MAKEKKFTAQTVRVPNELEKPLGHRLVDTGETFQGLVMRLIQRELEHDAPASEATTPSLSVMPSPFEGLSNDDIWTVQNLIEILKTRPQGSIFRNLETALRLAITDYRAIRSTHEAANQKAAGQSPEPPHRKHAGTRRNH